MFLKNLFIIIFSLFFNIKSENKYVKPVLFTTTVFGSGYLCYHYRKKIWNKIKNLPKKKLIFGVSCIGYI